MEAEKIQKELSSRAIHSKSNKGICVVDNRSKTVKQAKMVDVIQKQPYSNAAYRHLFQAGAVGWIQGNAHNFYIPDGAREPHLHAFGDGIVYTGIGHHHSYLAPGGIINEDTVGAAKDDLRGLMQGPHPQVNPNRGRIMIGALNILLHLHAQ